MLFNDAYPNQSVSGLTPSQQSPPTSISIISRGILFTSYPHPANTVPTVTTHMGQKLSAAMPGEMSAMPLVKKLSHPSLLSLRCLS